jgi:hypothetical protein
MLENQILFTTPSYPYPTLPANDSLTDATGQRFTKGDDIFTIISHTHCFANHILAQNINTPSVLLEYPRWEDFTAEVDKGYPILGISSYPVHLDRVMEMCEYVRQRSPATKILLGSYGGQSFAAKYGEDIQKKYVDHVVHGEGVKWLRAYLGEDTDRPIRQVLMPKGGGSPAFINKYPIGSVAFLVSGLGCPGGCDFCSTTAMFDRKRVEMLSPEDMVDHIRLYYENFPSVQQVFIIEEDHFRHPRYLDGVREYWRRNPQLCESIDWVAFGSIDYIGKYANKHGWDAIAESGIGTIFIGVESKFAGEHGYDKLNEIDARTVFNKLHSMGIRTIGAWICGWDFHNHSNIMEDLNYFVSLYPTYQQLTRLSPFPGTLLWEKLKEDDRVFEVPWEDVHFWSGAQKNIALEPHETLNLTEYGYDLLYKTWGPCLLRRLDVHINGYDYCRRSSNPFMRRHKAIYCKKFASIIWTLCRAVDRHAPNGVVRRRVRKIDEKYRQIIGHPTPIMQTMSKAVDALSVATKLKSIVSPLHRFPKEEPFKRYTYHKKDNGSMIPYTTEWPTKPSLATKLDMQANDMFKEIAAKALKAVRYSYPTKGDKVIDDYIMEQAEDFGYCFGF